MNFLSSLILFIAELIKKEPDEEVERFHVEELFDGKFKITLDNEVYIGSCTVFHRFPDGKRPGTHIEYRLHEILEGYKMVKKYG